MWQTIIPVAIASVLIGALAGAFVNHRFTLSREGAKADRVRERHLAALAAEVEYSAMLAATYLDEPFTAPLYRFPTSVHSAVFASLVSETFTDADVTALTDFYSLVDQMNRGLDAVDRYRAMFPEGGKLLEIEIDRLKLKAAEMRHPNAGAQRRKTSGFYEAAIDTVRRHLK